MLVYLSKKEAATDIKANYTGVYLPIVKSENIKRYETYELITDQIKTF